MGGNEGKEEGGEGQGKGGKEWEWETEEVTDKEMHSGTHL